MNSNVFLLKCTRNAKLVTVLFNVLVDQHCSSYRRSENDIENNRKGNKINFDYKVHCLLCIARGTSHRLRQKFCYQND